MVAESLTQFFAKYNFGKCRSNAYQFSI